MTSIPNTQSSNSCISFCLTSFLALALRIQVREDEGSTIHTPPEQRERLETGSCIPNGLDVSSRQVIQGMKELIALSVKTIWINLIYFWRLGFAIRLIKQNTRKYLTQQQRRNSGTLLVPKMIPLRL